MEDSSEKLVFKKKSTNELVGEDHVVGTWPDGSDKTIGEVYKLDFADFSAEYKFINKQSGSRKAEIFELACRILIGHAQAGIKPIPHDAFEVAKMAYALKDNM